MTQAEPYLDTPIARHVWDKRYRATGEDSIETTWRRVAHALVEPATRAAWEQRFPDVLRNFQFLPGGRIYDSG